MASGVTECRGVSGAGGAPASLTLQVLMYAAALVDRLPLRLLATPTTTSPSGWGSPGGWCSHAPRLGGRGPALFPRFPLLLLFE